MTWMTQADLGIHGYSMQAIHDLAVLAVRSGRGSSSDIDWSERVAAAASAIAIALCEADEPPTVKDLIRCAWRASDHVIADWMHHHGLDLRGHRRGEPGAHFARYWAHEPRDSAESRIVEGIALEQIWELLTPTGQEALTALALHGTYDEAAKSLGLSYFGLCSRLNRTRTVALRLWYEGETPPAWRGHDQRVQSYSKPLTDTYPCGHPRTAENTRRETRIVRGTARHNDRCRTCRRDRDAARYREKHAVGSGDGERHG